MEDRLKGAVVRIYDDAHTLHGMGFLVADHLVLSCSHVIADALKIHKYSGDEPPPGQVDVDFPFLNPRNFVKATVRSWFPVRPGPPEGRNWLEDLTLLQLEEPPPTGATPLQLSTRNSSQMSGHRFETVGVPKGQDDCVTATGVVRRETARRWIQIEAVKETGYQIEGGFSGGPVWNLRKEEFVGMVVAADRRPELRVGFMIPGQIILEAFPELGPWTIPPCPYHGLEAFQEDDKRDFYGRDAKKQELAAALAANPCVAIIGPSGCGKSSLVLAGLLPQLQAKDQWLIVQFRPGIHPLRDLAAAIVLKLEPGLGEVERLAKIPDLADRLAKDDIALNEVVRRVFELNPRVKNLLLVADQFEQLFTARSVPSERRLFLERLLSVTRPGVFGRMLGCQLALTLRSDFENTVRSFRPFSEDLRASAVVRVGPMNDKELEEAVLKPAENHGVSFEDRLMERIRNAVGGDPLRLPLMEFVLTKAWPHQKDRKLTHQAYEKAGGVDHALVQHATEWFHQKLSIDERPLVHRIAIQLIQPGQGAVDTRRVASRPEFDERSWTFIHKLADARLVIINEDPATQTATVEVIHEILLSGLVEFFRLTDEDRSFRIWQERVRYALREWTEAQGGLLQRGLLAESEKYRRERKSEISLAEHTFIKKSLRRRRVLRAMLTGLICLLLLLSGTSLFMWWLAEEKQIETIRSIAALYEEQGRQELLQGNGQRAMVYLGEACKATESPILHSWVAQPRRANSQFADVPASLRFLVAEAKRSLFTVESTLQGHIGSVLSASFSQDGQRIVTASADQTARVWEANTGKQLIKLEGHTKGIHSASFSADGRRILTTSGDKTARVWDADSGKQLAQLEGHDEWVRSGSFSADGQRIVTASPDKTARVWDAGTGEELAVLKGHTDSVTSATFSADGQRIVTASNDRTARVWDACFGRQRVKLERHLDSVTSASFSANGQRIVTASRDKTARVWDAGTGEELAVLKGHTDSVTSATFSADGQRIVTASNDRTARVWDAYAGKELARLEGHIESLTSASFGTDGQLIVTAGSDKTVRVWDAVTGKQWALLEGHADRVISASFSADGKRIVSASDDLTARVWHEGTGKRLTKLEGHTGEVHSASFSADGRRVVTASFDKTGRLWDANTGKEVARLEGHTNEVNWASFSADGQRIVTGGKDLTARVWDAGTGKQLVKIEGNLKWILSASFSADEQRIVTADLYLVHVLDASSRKDIAKLKGHTGLVRSASFSADGQRIVTACGDRTARIWDASTGKQLAKLEGHGSPVLWASFSADGQRIVTASSDKTARVWDVATGKQLVRLEGHTREVHSACFSADGQRVVTACADHTARIWDAGTGKQLAKIEAHLGPVHSACFSADGERIVTAGSDKTASIWDASLETGSPAEIAEYVRRYVPFKIENGQIVLVGVSSKTE